MTDDREREIRAVLDLSPTRLVEHWDNYAELYEWADNERSRRIRAILDSAPPAPRVFFPGDTVPAGVPVLYRKPSGLKVHVRDEPWEPNFGPMWEIVPPSEEHWQATVNRAKAARLSDPGTGEA